jgi:hypothetical protein
MGGGSGTIATTLTGSKGKEQSRNDAPDWARGYEMDAATRANTEAQRGYENYGGQRQAGANNDQQNAYQLYRNQVAGSPEMATGSNRLIGMLSQGGPANPYYGRPAYLANSQQLGADNLHMPLQHRQITLICSLKARWQAMNISGKRRQE